MSRPKQVQTTTNTYGYQPRTETASSNAVRDFQFQPDPSIGYQYAARRRQINEGYEDPLSAYSTPEMREQSRRSQTENLGQQEAQSLAEEMQRMNLAQYGQTMDYANLMNPQLVQTGGTTTQQMQGGLLGSILGGAAQIGSQLGQAALL